VPGSCRFLRRLTVEQWGTVVSGMSEIVAVVGAYAVGAWIAVVIVVARWFRNQTITTAGFLTLSGWAAVATVAAAIVIAAA
jgi:hypothetical protein